MTIGELVKKVLWPYRRHNSRTVRYAFPLMFVVASFLGANAIDTQTNSYIQIETEDTSVRAGEEIVLHVYASVHTPVNAIEVDLEFPAEQLEVTGVDVGQSVITLWTEEPYVENNKVILRGGTFRKGFLGRHLIATVNAKAKTSGIAYFEVGERTFLAGDGSGSEVDVTDHDNERIALYVANEDGTLTIADTSGGSGEIDAMITIKIVTDIDGDGEVTLTDISRFMAAWNSKNEIYDFSGDGKMTFRDFAIILAHSVTQ